MNCRQTNQWKEAYVDGALRPGDRQRLEAHLAACPACRDRVALAGRVAGLAGPALKLAVSRPLLTAAQVRRLDAARARGAQSRRSVARRLLLAGTLPLLFLTGLALWGSAVLAVGGGTHRILQVPNVTITTAGSASGGATPPVSSPLAGAPSPTRPARTTAAGAASTATPRPDPSAARPAPGGGVSPPVATATPAHGWSRAGRPAGPPPAVHPTPRPTAPAAATHVPRWLPRRGSRLPRLP